MDGNDVEQGEEKMMRAERRGEMGLGKWSGLHFHF
jgi:hypothetical protein